MSGGAVGVGVAIVLAGAVSVPGASGPGAGSGAAPSAAAQAFAGLICFGVPLALLAWGVFMFVGRRRGGEFDGRAADEFAADWANPAEARRLMLRRLRRLNGVRLEALVHALVMIAFPIAGTLVVKLSARDRFLAEVQTGRGKALLAAIAVYALATVRGAWLTWRAWRRNGAPLAGDPDYKPLPDSAKPLVAELLAPYARRTPFAFDEDELPVLWKRSAKAAAALPQASIEADPSGVHLVVSSGWLKLAAKDKAGARAILTHEMGHHEQKDAPFWAGADVYWPKILRVQLLGWLLSLLCVPFGGPRAAAAAAPFVLASTAQAAFVFAAWIFIRRARRRAEYLADEAAALYDDGEALCRQLESLQALADGGTRRLGAPRLWRAARGAFGVHPSIPSRCRAVRRTIKRLGGRRPAPQAAQPPQDREAVPPPLPEAARRGASVPPPVPARGR